MDEMQWMIIEALRGKRGMDIFAAEPIKKGFSGDEKYRVTTGDGKRFLLRIGDPAGLWRKQEEYRHMQNACDLGVAMAKPLGSFLLNEKLFTLYTWCEGEDCEKILPYLSEKEQYALGEVTGQYLRSIHTLPSPLDQENWESRFNRKIDEKIRSYRRCGIMIPGAQYFIEYLEANRALLTGRPQCFQHGDYHTGNMVMDKENRIHILDFDRFDFGDPYEEFNRIVWSAALSPAFATGQLEGYFLGRPPDDFFKLLALYISSNTLSSFPWAVTFGHGEVAIMKKQAEEVLQWFDNMSQSVPKWYTENSLK